MSASVIALPKLRHTAVQFVRNNDALLSISHRIWGKRPVENWPAYLSKLYYIELPNAVKRRPATDASGDSNINILFNLLEKTRDVRGDIAECGVYKGASILPMALYVKQHAIDKAILGFDSFEGFDPSVAFDITLGGQEDPQKRMGGFSDTSYERLQRKVEIFDLGSTLHLVKGFFEDTLQRVAARRFSFVHLDCDIYQSYKECLEFFYPRLEPGGVVLFDEYNDPPWPGCNMAVDEFLRDKPERPIQIESDSYQKWYIRKSCAE